MKYIRDTNIFNRLLDGKLCVQDLPSDGVFVATYVQRDELLQTREAERRDQLFSTFKEFISTLTPTESFLLDVSRLDQARWSDGKVFEALKTALDSIKIKPNNNQDALIAEVAIVDGFTLLTCDKDLARVAKNHGAEVQEFA